MSKIYRRRNNGSYRSVYTFIEVKDSVIVRAWYDVPGGQWRGNDPRHMIGQKASPEWLKQNGYKRKPNSPENHPGDG